MTWLSDRRLLALGFGVWALTVVLNLGFGPSIGHDEAAFALAARGEQPPGMWLYRSQGTIAIAKIGIALGGSELALRLASGLLGFLVPLAVYALGRAAFRPRIGAWAVAVIAGAHPIVLRNTELLSDLPAVACMLGGIAIVVGELDRGRGHADDHSGPSWRLVLAAPVLAAAFYMRYGSAPVIAFALAVAGVLWWRSIARRPLPVLATVGLLALATIPHFVHSLDATGSLLGVMKVSAGMPRRAYVGEGLVTYLTSNPFMYYGFVVAPVMVAGVIGVWSTRRRAPIYIAVLAIAQIVSLGIQSHGQPRYVFTAVCLLVVVGVAALADSKLARPRAAFAIVAAAWAGVLVTVPIYQHHVDRTRQQIVEAARVIRTEAAGRPCAAVAMVVPQLTWHSGCETFVSALMRGPLPADRVQFLVSMENWPVDAEALARVLEARLVPLPTHDPRARVWRLE